MSDDGREITSAEDANSRCMTRALCVLGGDDRIAHSRTMHCERRSQGSAGSAQSAIQCELAHEPPTSETILVDDTGGTEDSDCDR